jgi:nicotinamidase-related amidase
MAAYLSRVSRATLSQERQSVRWAPAPARLRIAPSLTISAARRPNASGSRSEDAAYAENHYLLSYPLQGRPRCGARLTKGDAMKKMLGVLILLIVATGAGAQGKTIVDDWSTVQPPQPPVLAPVTVDPASTALLLLDFQDRIIGGRPRSLATVPRVKGLLDFARSAGLVVAYSLGGTADASTIVSDLRPGPSDHVVHASVDKFYGTDLEAYLKSKGVTTVIITGLQAEGAVLGTSIGASLRGFKVIVPVDGTASPTLYAEQYVAWHLMNAPAVRGNVTLTRTDLIRR